MRSAEVIDYRLIGDDLQAVIVTLDPGEAVVAEAGAMMYMEDGIEMATTLDANGTGSGLMGKLLGAGKRLIAGESFFITMFANADRKRRDVAFAAPYPGKVLPVNLAEWGGTVSRLADRIIAASPRAQVAGSTGRAGVALGGLSVLGEILSGGDNG